MRYGNYEAYNDGGYGEGSYSNYGRRGVPGTGRGRYREGGYSGGRGSGRYRGDDMLQDMQDSYGAYRESSEAYSRGNYGAEQDTIKSLDYMLKAVKEFMKMLSQEAGSQEEMQMIQRTAKEIGQM